MVLKVAQLMLVSARTVPKSSGVDDTLTDIVYEEKRIF